MSLKSTHFSGISFRTCNARWCADSLVARRHFALSRFDFRSFRVSVGKMTPGRGSYQSTNLPYTNEQIPESYESLADSNVRMLGESDPVEIQLMRAIYGIGSEIMY